MKLNSFTIAATSVIALASCSHKNAERNLAERLTTESEITAEELEEKVFGLIASTPNLSTKQRQNLTSLVDSAVKQAKARHAESMKLRSLLVTEMFSPHYSETRARAITERLRSNHQDGVKLAVSAIDEADVIFGRLVPRSRHQKELSTEILDLHLGRR